MMPEEWPIAAQAADVSLPVRPAGGDRLTTVRADFFLKPGARLTEQERALMTAMLHCLIGDIGDELRAVLPNGLTAANDDGNLGLVDRLFAAKLLDRPALVRLLLRRADEERIAGAANARSGRREARVLQGLVSHGDGAVAAAAMALILARGRRRDRFGQCLIHFDDLSAEEARALVQLVCAALRIDLMAIVRAAEADRLLGEAAAQVLASHDPGSSIEILCANLVRLLDEEGDLADELIIGAAMEGEMTFVAQALGRRASINGEQVIAEILSGDARRVMTVLRAAGVSRQVAARLLAGIGDLLAISDPVRAMETFDALSDSEAEDARSWLTADRSYRDAVDTLARAGG